VLDFLQNDVLKLLCHEMAQIVASFCQGDYNKLQSTIDKSIDYFAKRWSFPYHPVDWEDNLHQVWTKLHSIQILPMSYFEFLHGSEKGSCWCLETELKSFEKYTNNGAWSQPVQPNQPSEAAHLFSHLSFVLLTHQKSIPTIVVDIQGTPNEWTDPAVHCYGEVNYGSTNLGKDGFVLFFRNHNKYKLPCCSAFGIVTDDDIERIVKAC